MEQRNREIARVVLGKRRKRSKIKFGIKKKMDTEKWRENIAQEGKLACGTKDEGWGMREGRERKRESAGTVWRSKCV